MDNFLRSWLYDFYRFLFKEDKRESVEDTIPIRNIYDDGICYSGKDDYSKVICFEDINYELLEDDERGNLFNNWSLFLNSFNKDVNIQLLYMNRKFKKDVDFLTIKNEFNEISNEYVKLIKDNIPCITYGMYIVISIKSKRLTNARIFLERVESDILHILKNLGITSWSLNGKEYNKLLSNFIYPNQEQDDDENFYPNTFKFRKDKFKMGSYFCISNHLLILASELSDRILTDILSVDENIFLSIQLKSIDQVSAVKNVRRKNTDIQKMIIDEQQKAIRSGYDIDILPSDLITYGKDAKMLLNELQNKDERLFEFSISILVLDKSYKKVQNTVSKISAICSKYNCVLKVLDYMQEDGFLSTLPIGINKLEFKRELTTSAVSVFIPFKTKDLCSKSKESIYYGVNPLSKNLIMVDRKKLKNPNGLILGTPGSGKSFSAKKEIVNSILFGDDDIIISDPEREYSTLVKEFGGEIIKLSAKSKDYINPFDININYDNTDIKMILKDKINFIISLMELIIDRSITAEEKSVIDRCLPKVYEKYFKKPKYKNIPTLEDLYNILKDKEGEIGKKLSTEMEIYVIGSLNVFNHHTNVNLDKKLICFDIKDLGNQLKKIGMLTVQEHVWNKVSKNRDKGKNTRYYIDEFHLLLKDEQTSQYSVEMWKRFRKWGGIPTGITQNTKDFLGSREIENIFDNTDFMLMFNQSGSDKEFIQSRLNLSKYQLKYITNSNEGEGLLFYGNTIIPFIDYFPKDTKLYKKMTTKLQELK